MSVEDTDVYITSLPRYLLKGYEITVKRIGVYYRRKLRHNKEHGLHIIINGERINYTKMRRSIGLYIPNTLQGEW